MTDLAPAPAGPTTTATKLRAALHRPVRPLAARPNHYLVGGNPGEARTHYLVHWDPADPASHRCSCYRMVGGHSGTVFERGGATLHGCSHVTAAQIHRRRADAVEARAREAVTVRAAAEAALAEAVPLPTDPIFHPAGEPPFPDWVQTFRRAQWDAIEAVMGCYDAGAQVVMLQAPVGTGKTLSAEGVRRLIGGDGLYVCSTKTLQDQAARDFPYARVLKGRSNYPTLSGGVKEDGWGRAVALPASGGDGAVTAADCTASGGKRECRWCSPISQCPYRLARARAQTSRFAILNTSYFLTDANKGGRLFTGRDLAILDEADLLEGELLGQAEVKITKRRMERLRMAPPPKKTVADSWPPWVLNEAIPRVRERLLQVPPIDVGTVPQIKERKGLEELDEALVELAAGLPLGGWVYDGYNYGDVVFRPIKVDAWGRRMLWPHAKRFLLMSGSIISADEMAGSLGLDGAYRLVDVPMTFPAENRPINIVALAEVTAKNQDQAWPRIVEGVAGVLALHPDERVLVHTVSYPMATFLMSHLWKRTRRPLVTYSNARERDAALQRYKQTPGSVLIAPSMDRGVDLPGDLCRVMVIAKIPFPNLGDKRTAARLHGTRDGGSWYAVNTVRTLVQMTGRGVRSADDHAVAYILDHTFTTNIWRKNKALLPGWWCEAVNWRYPVHRLLRAAAPPSPAAV